MTYDIENVILKFPWQTAGGWQDELLDAVAVHRQGDREDARQVRRGGPHRPRHRALQRARQAVLAAQRHRVSN